MADTSDLLDHLATYTAPAAAPRPAPRVTSPAPVVRGGPTAAPKPTGHQITRQDVIDMYRRYAGYDPIESEIAQHVGQYVPDLDVAAQRFFNVGAGGGGAEGFDLEAFLAEMGGGGFELSDQEKELLGLQSEQLREQIRLNKEENARVARRREMLDKELRGKYGIGLEEFEGQEALRSADISRAQSERLQKALAGDLPVDPALERQISEDEAIIRDKLQQQLGPGYETSTPGIQSLATFKQRAEELRMAARKGEIESGINPAAASAQFGLSLVGSEAIPDTSGISAGLAAATQSRAASIEAARSRAASLIALQDLALRSRTAASSLALERERLGLARSSAEPTSGAGVGRLAGSILGSAAGAYFGSGGSLYQTKRANTDPLYT